MLAEALHRLDELGVLVQRLAAQGKQGDHPMVADLMGPVRERSREDVRA